MAVDLINADVCRLLVWSVRHPAIVAPLVAARDPDRLFLERGSAAVFVGLLTGRAPGDVAAQLRDGEFKRRVLWIAALPMTSAPSAAEVVAVLDRMEAARASVTAEAADWLAAFCEGGDGVEGGS